MKLFDYQWRCWLILCVYWKPTSSSFIWQKISIHSSNIHTDEPKPDWQQAGLKMPATWFDGTYTAGAAKANSYCEWKKTDGKKKERKSPSQRREEGPGSLSLHFAATADWKPDRGAQGGQRGREREESVQVENSVCTLACCSSDGTAVAAAPDPVPTERRLLCAEQKRQNLASCECHIIGFLFNRGYCRKACGEGKVYVDWF